VPDRDIIVMGASAGGLETYRTILWGLPVELRASVFLVLHSGSDMPNRLAQLLARRSRLPVETAVHGKKIEPGRVYVAPPDYHLTFRDQKMLVQRGPKENRQRPSVDTLFRSAARNFGPRVIGVVLSGLLDDGAFGLQRIKDSGGYTVVQNPEDAMFCSMPCAALELQQPDRIASATEIPEILTQIAAPAATAEPKVNRERRSSQEAPLVTTEKTPTGKPSGFTCPECHGSLRETQGELPVFECRIGHRFSIHSLLEENEEDMENALWVALRTLQESAAMSRRLAERARRSGHLAAAKRYDDAAETKLVHAETLRKLLATELPKSSAAD